jgi:hypothetical protein
MTIPQVERYYSVDPHAILPMLAPERLVPELDRLGGDRYLIGIDYPIAVLFERHPKRGDRPRVKLVNLQTNLLMKRERPPIPPDVYLGRLPDLDLLRAGHLTPEELHPLVRSALFPARPRATSPVGPPDAESHPPEPARVRCRGEWHMVQVRDGALRTPHGVQEEERESALRALGGEVTGCFAVRHTWATGAGRPPRLLRDQRRELFLRVQHGDAPGVLRMLDAGADPACRDGRRRTLLHYLHMLDHTELLPRLLDAGLDLEAVDQGGRTPLNMAVGDHGTVDLVRDLMDAGARIDTVDDIEFGLIDFIKRFKRTDLAWLQERLEKEHPDIGGGWFDPEEYY